MRLIHKREQARAKKNWGDADEVREELRSKGVELYDKTHEWQAKDGRKGVIPIGATGPGSLTASAACTLSDSEIIRKINEREEARRIKDFAASDLKREELRAAGVDVFDKDRCWKTNDGRQGMIGVSVEAHLAGTTQAMSEADIDARLQQREQARAQKDWATADKLREELRARGIEIFDQTSMWKASDGRVGMLPPQPGQVVGHAALGSMMNPAVTAAAMATSALGLVATTGAGKGALTDTAIFALIEEREQARKSKNWAVADKIRDGLRARGVEVYDKTGQWRATDGREGTIVGAGKGGVTAVAAIPGAGALVASGGASGGFLSDADIVACLNQREIHRANKNWAQADVIRTTLRQAGVDVYDKEARWTTRDGRSGSIPGAGQGGAGGGAVVLTPVTMFRLSLRVSLCFALCHCLRLWLFVTYIMAGAGRRPYAYAGCSAHADAAADGGTAAAGHSRRCSGCNEGTAAADGAVVAAAADAADAAVATIPAAAGMASAAAANSTDAAMGQAVSFVLPVLCNGNHVCAVYPCKGSPSYARVLEGEPQAFAVSFKSDLLPQPALALPPPNVAALASPVSSRSVRQPPSADLLPLFQEI